MPKLIFSEINLMNAILSDTADGSPVYRIDSGPPKNFDRVTTISRFVGSHSLPIFPDLGKASTSPTDKTQSIYSYSIDGSQLANDSDSTMLRTSGLEERVVAQIEWHAVHQSVFKLGNGREIKLKDYMESKGVIPWKKAFTAGDGKAYIWVETTWSCKLKRNDGSKAVVAKYLRGLNHTKGEHSYLEVEDEIVPILDEILMSFIWYERRREAREGNFATYSGY